MDIKYLYIIYIGICNNVEILILLILFKRVVIIISVIKRF